jgi:UDP-2,3-diacylglucosamine hydrolase
VDIGQTVVVKNKAVIAVEAIEGTNNCIKRAANSFAWFKDNRVTVCKVSKPEQDDRFDVPTIGPKTVDAMPANSILVFEAGQCFFIDQARAISKANQKNILLCSVILGIK